MDWGVCVLKMSSIRYWEEKTAKSLQECFCFQTKKATRNVTEYVSLLPFPLSSILSSLLLLFRCSIRAGNRNEQMCQFQYLSLSPLFQPEVLFIEFLHPFANVSKIILPGNLHTFLCMFFPRDAACIPFCLVLQATHRFKKCKPGCFFMKMQTKNNDP